MTSWTLTPVDPREARELADFLGAVFHSPAGFSDPALLNWKYFAPRADWTGPRSFVFRDSGRIVAHAGVWPLRCRAASGVVEGMHILDWAASPDAPGAGVAIYRDTMRLSRILFVAGGSGIGRKVLHKMGIARVGEGRVWALPLRPWPQFRTRAGSPLWKSAAKLGRNTLWRLSAARRTAWTAQPVQAFPGSLAALLDQPPPPGSTPFARAVEQLNYVLACPVDSCRGFLLSNGGAPRGYFILARSGPQTRIADLYVVGGDDAWAAAYTAAAAAAADDPAALELTAFSSAPFADRGLAAAGFRPMFPKPLWLAGSHGPLENAPPLHAQFLESDAFFLPAAADPFVT